MRWFFWIVGPLVGLAVAGLVALAALPQVNEYVIEMTCPMSQPDAACQRRMVAMGHIWSQKDEIERARGWYARAAEAGNLSAMFHLAWTYQRSAFSEPNRGQPGRLASKFGTTGMLPQDAPPPRDDNMANAALWYRRAAEQGYAPAMNNLGQLYIIGALGQPDLQEAFRWHLAAARAGNPIGAMNVSLAYRIGQGVTADQVESQKWAHMKVAEDSPDLSPVTLARTTPYGSRIDAKVIATIRQAAVRHEMVEVKFAPMKPSAAIPTFRQVQDKLHPPPREPTLKQLQR